MQEIFEALSDKNRRQILSLLKKQEMSVKEIGEHFDISGASLSHHLNKLKSANLVFSKRKGQQIIYYLHLSVFEEFTLYLNNIFATGDNNE